MDEAKNAVRGECRSVARSQGGEDAIETTITDGDGLCSEKDNPGCCKDGWIDGKNVDDSGNFNPMGGGDYGGRRFEGDGQNISPETWENPNNDLMF